MFLTPEVPDALPVLAAPSGGVWWLRGTRDLAAVFELIDEDTGARAPAVVVSEAGLTSWAIAVPEGAAPGARYALTGFQPEVLEEDGSEPLLVVTEGAVGPEGRLTLDAPLTSVVEHASGSDGISVPNPLELFADSCTNHPPLLRMGSETVEKRVRVVLAIPDADLVVVDAAFGDLDEPVAFLANAAVAEPRHVLVIDDAPGEPRELRLRLRSLATGAAGPERVVAIDVPPPEERFAISACGCAAGSAARLASPTSPANGAALLVLVFALRSRVRRRR